MQVKGNLQGTKRSSANTSHMDDQQKENDVIADPKIIMKKLQQSLLMKFTKKNEDGSTEHSSMDFRPQMTSIDEERNEEKDKEKEKMVFKMNC